MAKVLVVEDDILISDLIEDALIGGGYDVCGVARTAAEAIALGERERPDLAVIDVRLADGSDGTTVAARLMAQFSLGVLYATGNTDYLLATNAAGHACLKKPYRPSDVVRSLKIIERLIGGSLSTEGRPAGLFLLDRSTASGGC